MGQGATPKAAPQGWGIDWASSEVRRRYFAMVAIGTSLNLAQMTASVLLPVWAFGLGSGSSTIVSTVVLAAVLCVAITWGMESALKPGFASTQERGQFVALASNRDRRWGLLWLIFVGMVPMLVPLAAYFTGLIGSILPALTPVPSMISGSELMRNASFAAQTGVVTLGIFGGHAVMRSLRDPALGPLPVMPQGTPWYRSSIGTMQDNLATVVVAIMVFLPLLGILLFATVARS